MISISSDGFTAESASSSTSTRGSRDERAGERDALALAARDGEAAVADDAVEPAVHLLDDLVGAGGAQCRRPARRR